MPCLSSYLIRHACPVLQASARRPAYTGGELRPPKTFGGKAASAADLPFESRMCCIKQVDGNDVAFFPCNRSIADSFRLLNASIAFMGVAHQHPDYHLMELFPKVRPVTPYPFPSALSEFLADANRCRCFQSSFSALLLTRLVHLPGRGKHSMLQSSSAIADELVLQVHQFR